MNGQSENLFFHLFRFFSQPFSLPFSEIPSPEIDIFIETQLKELENNMQRAQVRHAIKQTPVDKPIDVKGISSASSMIQLKEMPHSLSTKKIVADQNLHKFKSHFPLADEFKDAEGYSLVLVTEIEMKSDAQPDGSVVYWIMPYVLKESLVDYKNVLNTTYDVDGIAVVASKQDIQSFKSHLVITKIEGKWSRACILSFTEPNLVELEDIDSGKRAINDVLRDVMKVPNEAELLKPAYAFRVVFEDFENSDISEIECGDIIGIRITHPTVYGLCFAKVKFETENLAENEVQETEMNPSNQADAVKPVQEDKCLNLSKRLFFEQIQVREFNVGPKIKMMFIDGSRLDEAKIHVCEGTKENLTFYHQLADDIQKYVKQNPNAANYKPK